MPALDLITLADLKGYMPLQGNAKDAVLPLYITTSSRWIESAVGRRLVYRAPPDGDAAVVSAQSWATGAIAVGNQPGPGRTLIVNWTSATAGVLTVTGTVDGTPGVTETFDAADGKEQHGLKFFTAVSAAAAAAAVGGGTVSVTTSLGYVEYHTPRASARSFLDPLEWPVRNVFEVNEDASRAYGTGTKLTPDTDYLVGRSDGEDRLIRLSSRLPIAWTTGWRAEKLVHSAGYTRRTVPEEAKDVCRRLTKLLYDEVNKGLIEIASGSNALGNWSRFGPARLTREMSLQLSALKRRRFGAETGERDFDLEAA